MFGYREAAYGELAGLPTFEEVFQGFQVICTAQDMYCQAPEDDLRKDTSASTLFMA